MIYCHFTESFLAEKSLHRKSFFSFRRGKRSTWFWSAHASLLSSASLVFFIFKNIIFTKKTIYIISKCIKLHSFFENTFDKIPPGGAVFNCHLQRWKEVKTWCLQDFKNQIEGHLGTILDFLQNFVWANCRAIVGHFTKIPKNMMIWYNLTNNLHHVWRKFRISRF